MQRLGRIRLWIRAPKIQTPQLEILAQHHLDALQKFRMTDHPPKDFALIHEVRQPVGVLLLAEFRPGVFSLGFQLPSHRRSQLREPARVHDAAQQ
jgi:hypothetical protein